MGNDIKPPFSDPISALKNLANQNRASEAEQLRKSQANQMAEAAKKAAQDSARAAQESAHSMEMVRVLDNLVQEGMNVPKASPGESGGMQGGQEGFNSNLQKDFQTLREFIRESSYLVSQGMDLTQAINKIKVDQGGAFWQNLQQVLQKQILIGKQSLQEDQAMPGLKKDPLLSGETTKTQESARSSAARAFLELLKAESSPQLQKEQFLLALQLLSKGDLKESSEKLFSYLRKKEGFSEQELAYYYFQDSRKEIFQGPMLRQKIQPSSFWYLLFGIGAFGVSHGLGLNLAGSITVGVATSVLLFVFSWVWGRK